MERAQSEPKRSDAASSADSGRPIPGRREAAIDCAWCGGPITPRSRGPIRTWCSATCLHRAREQTRAASSGRSGVQFVERRVECPVPVTPARRDWPALLDELSRQVDDGRIYDRDLPDLSEALRAVLEAFRRRPSVRSGSFDDQRRERVRQQARRGPIT